MGANWRLVAAVFVGVAVASSLAVGAPVYLNTLNRMSLDTAFARTTDHFLKIRTYVPFVPLQEQNLDAADETFSGIRETTLSDVGDDVVRHLRTDPMFLGTPVFPLPITRPPSDAPRGYFQVLSDLEPHIRVVEGRAATARIEEGDGGPILEGVVAARARQFLPAAYRRCDRARQVGRTARAGSTSGSPAS